MKLTRRTFVLGSGAVASLRAKAAPGNRVTVGVIGLGRQTAKVNMVQFVEMPDVQVVAVCDVDAWRLETGKKQVESAYAKQAGSSYKGCRTYKDYHEMLASKDIDAIMVATPDHWHVPMCIDAVKAGKDVTCEKPLSRHIGESRELRDLVAKHKRIFRNDSEFRSLENFHRAVELVRNGRIGKVHTIRVGVPREFSRGAVGCPPQPEMPVPPELDYERWQGPAPRAPYTELRVHKRHTLARPYWMRHLYYCDGMLTNWGSHLFDIAQWGANTEHTTPVVVEARGTYPPPESFWNVLAEFEAEYRYANGVRLYLKADKPYTRFEGSDGWIMAGYPKALEAEPAAILNSKIRDSEVRFPFKSDKQDFIDAVKTRGRTLEDADVTHRVMTICHLANIAMRVGKKLEWDPVKERFSSREANAFLSKTILEPKHG